VERQNKSAGGGAFDGVPKFNRSLDYVCRLVACIRACTVVGILELCDSIPFMCGGDGGGGGGGGVL
jgi:hypothetical protein